ncbi:MAG: hypothetical protein ACUVUG_05755 [Candidatus Aminicenantia bacterium]
MSFNEIDRFLKNHKDQGYRFIGAESEITWFEAFKFSQWEKRGLLIELS